MIATPQIFAGVDDLDRQNVEILDPEFGPATSGRRVLDKDKRSRAGNVSDLYRKRRSVIAQFAVKAPIFAPIGTVGSLKIWGKGSARRGFVPQPEFALVVRCGSRPAKERWGLTQA